MLNKKSFGVIIVYKEKGENLFLLLQNNDAEGSWGFPKGHIEAGETPRETALRELEEEAGITEVKLFDVPLIHEEYERTKKNGKKFLKTNDYFISFVESKEVKIREKEIHTYKWVSFKEALDTLNYGSRKEVLKQAQKYIKNEFSK